LVTSHGEEVVGGGEKDKEGGAVNHPEQQQPPFPLSIKWDSVIYSHLQRRRQNCFHIQGTQSWSLGGGDRRLGKGEKIWKISHEEEREKEEVRLDS
jgi:hypothetical protein